MNYIRITPQTKGESLLIKEEVNKVVDKVNKNMVDFMNPQRLSAENYAKNLKTNTYTSLIRKIKRFITKIYKYLFDNNI